MRYQPIEHVCQYDDDQCSGLTEVRIDPYLYELYDEVQYMALCDYHYLQRADDV